MIFKIPSPIFFANVDFFRDKLTDAVGGHLEIDPSGFRETHDDDTAGPVATLSRDLKEL